MTNKITVTATNMSSLVENAFMSCLFNEGEDTTNYVRVEGLWSTFGLHPQRLEEKRELVTALLAELPAEFKESPDHLLWLIHIANLNLSFISILFIISIKYFTFSCSIFYYLHFKILYHYFFFYFFLLYFHLV